MILTLKDIGVPECVLSGPPQLVNVLHLHSSVDAPGAAARGRHRPVVSYLQPFGVFL